MSEDSIYTKPEGSPDLVRFKYLGDDILIDHKQGSISAIGRNPRCCFDRVLKYLVDEGFLKKKETNQDKEENI